MTARIFLTDAAGYEHEVLDCPACAGPYAITVDEGRACCYRCGATSSLTPLGRLADAKPSRATREAARLLCRAGTTIRVFALSTRPGGTT